MSQYNLRSSATIVDRQPSSPFRAAATAAQPNRVDPETTLLITAENEEMDSFLPGNFSGSETDSDPREWFRKFELYCTLKGLKAETKKAAFALSLRDVASRWYELLEDNTKSDFKQLHDTFIARFTTSPISQSEKMRRFWTAKQESKESIRNFVDRMRSNAVEIDVNDPILTTAIQSGLKPSIKQYVTRQNPQTVSALLEQALIAESTDFQTEASIDDVSAAIRRLEDKIDKVQIAAMSTETKNRPSSPRQPSDHRRDRRTLFEQERYSFSPNDASVQNNQYVLRRQSPSPFRSSRSRNPSSQRSVLWQDPDVGQQNFVSSYNSEQCYRCLGNHNARYCAFKTLVCRYCSVRGHIMKACRKRLAQGQAQGSRGYNNQNYEF